METRKITPVFTTWRVLEWNVRAYSVTLGFESDGKGYDRDRLFHFIFQEGRTSTRTRTANGKNAPEVSLPCEIRYEHKVIQYARMCGIIPHANQLDIMRYRI